MSAEFVNLRDQNQTFEHVAAFQPLTLNIMQGGEPEVIGGTRASANLFILLGVEPKLGRTFLPEEVNRAPIASWFSVTDCGSDALVLIRRSLGN